MRHLILSAPKMPGSSVLGVKALFSFLRKNYLYVVFFLVLIGAGWPGALHAEGSINFYPSNYNSSTYRAVLYPKVKDQTPDEKGWYPFATSGTHYVYAKAGERIAVGSSVQGKGNGKIELYNPKGVAVNFANTGTTRVYYTYRGTKYKDFTNGFIRNRTDEKGGPVFTKNLNDNSAGSEVNDGFIPLYYTVPQGGEGIYRVEFIPATTSNGTMVYPNINVDWTEANQTYNPYTNYPQYNYNRVIIAWDITVFSGSGTSWTKKPGRVYANILNLTGSYSSTGNTEANRKYTGRFYGETYVLTNDGYVYKVSPNGMLGICFSFFVNNQGLTTEPDGKGNPTYFSSPTWSNANNSKPTGVTNPQNLINYYCTKDPRKPDSETSVTQKMFYTDPRNTDSGIAKNDDILYDISYGDGTTGKTWLLRETPSKPTIDSLDISGIEGTGSQVGQRGGYITFEANQIGSYEIVISGYKPGVDPKTGNPAFKAELKGSAQKGKNTISWDGKAFLADDNGFIDDSDEDSKVYPSSGDYQMWATVSLRGAEVHFPYIDVEANVGGLTLQRLEGYKGEQNFETDEMLKYGVYWNDSKITDPDYDKGEGTNSAKISRGGSKPIAVSSKDGAHAWMGINDIDGVTRGNKHVIDTWTYVQGPVSEPEVIGGFRIAIVDLDVEEVSDKDANGNSTLKQRPDGKYEITYTIPVRNLPLHTEFGADDDAIGATFKFKAPTGFVIESVENSPRFIDPSGAIEPANYEKASEYRYSKDGVREEDENQKPGVGGRQYAERNIQKKDKEGNEIPRISENVFTSTEGGVDSNSLSGNLNILFNSTQVFTITVVSDGTIDFNKLTVDLNIGATASITRPKDVTDQDATDRTPVLVSSSSDASGNTNNPIILNPDTECEKSYEVDSDGKIIKYYYWPENYPFSAGGNACNNIKSNSIIIAAVSVDLSIDASCVHCPITATAIVGDNPENYTLYYYPIGGTAKSIGTLKSDGTVGNNKKGSLVFTFTQEELDAIPTTDGKLIFYIDAGNGKRSQDVTVNIYPESATWTGDTNNTWKEATNWTSKTGGYPIWCTDVLIPENKSSYPVADNANGATSGTPATVGDACRDITFEHGASVAGVHKLHYRRAFVQFRPERNRWYTLAAPLKYMYSADYSFTDTESYETVKDGTYGISPRVFMMYFDQKSPDATYPNLDGENGSFTIGSFSKPFTRLEEPISSPEGQGQAFALWVNGKDKYNYAEEAFRTGEHYTFPRLRKDDVHHYYVNETGMPTGKVADLSAKRGYDAITDDDWNDGHKSTNYMDVSNYKDNRYRFAFEDITTDGINVTLKLNGGENLLGTTPAAATRMVANPFMSYMDFSKIESDKIQKFYRIWDGKKFEAVPTGETWNGLNESDNPFIAPMQAFFVEKTGGDAAEEMFSFNMNEALVDPGTYLNLRASRSTSNDAIYLDLDMKGVKTRAIVALRENASGNYASGEDIFKLFSPGGVPEVYTLTDDGVASEINLTRNLSKQRIPVGIAMNGTGTGTLIVSGLEDFAADPIYFVDEQTGRKQNLHTNPVVTIEKTSASEKLTQRYFLEINRAGTAIDAVETSGSSIHWVREAGSLMIYSQAGRLQSVEVFDISGHSIQSFAPKGSSCVISTARFNKGIYLFQVVSDKETKTFKLTF